METNNKVREALEAYIALWDRGTMNDPDELKRVIGKMRKALSAPLRNCDVGTADEQHERFYKFCHDERESCLGCPSFEWKNCALAWAQTPYEEGGAE